MPGTIEATCTACGTVNQVAEGDIPVGARFISCWQCKARVAIPTKTGAMAAVLPPGINAAAPGAAAAAAAALENLDLEDLPAPRTRTAAAMPPPEPARTSTRGLAEAFDPELPAPRVAKKAPAPPPPAAPGTFELDDFLAGPATTRPAAQNISDLPAPRAAIPKAPPAAPPAATMRGAPVVDLPAPKGSVRPPEMPTAPQRNGGHALDLPTPKVKGPPGATVPMGSGSHEPIVDLPAPKNALGDLPTPKRGGGGVVDLPTPRGGPQPGIIDLPMPKPGGGVTDLPMPKAGISDLPMPKPGQIGDLPMPKPGQIGDLPMPKPGGAGDLPAPKGFFEDLPQPAPNSAQSHLPAPKGFFDDLPAKPNRPHQPAPELPAPKGFFDDLPGRPNAARAQQPEVPAPKGYFEDLPARPNASKPEVPAPKGFFEDLPARPNASKPEVPAPKGFFDDLPGHVNPAKPAVPAPKGFFEDLPQPSSGGGGGAEPLELDNGALELDGGGLELAAPTEPAPAPSNFDDLDLSKPSAPQSPGVVSAGAGTGIRVTTPSKVNQAAAQNPYGTAQPRGMHGTFPPLNQQADAVLELEEPRPGARKDSAKLTRREPRQKGDPVAAAKRARIIRFALLGTLLAGALGAGGYLYLQRRAEKQERAEEIETGNNAARSALAIPDWNRASAAVRKVLEVDETDEVALGIGAEAAFASNLANGDQASLTRGRKYITTAREAERAGPELDRAGALQALTMAQFDKALPKLQQLVQSAPKDGVVQLYLGWAQAMKGDQAAAIKAFTDALVTEGVKVYALYGRAKAYVATGNVDGARADYEAILKINDKHIGAMVGVADVLPASQNSTRESAAMSILARKDLATADPRAVGAAWVLAAEAARVGGRYDVARERYNKALAINASDIAALTGLAEADLRDGKLDTAATTITKATTLAKDDMHAQIVAAEIEIRQKRLDVAAQRLSLLAARQPPPPVTDQWRLKLAQGHLADANGEDGAAVDFYVAAAKLAGERDLTPTLIAVSKLSEMQSKVPDKADEYRKIADELLSKLVDEANKDPRLLLTLGIAYLQAYDPSKAEPLLRHYTEVREKDAEGYYYYGKALAARGEKVDEAIENLKTAIKLDPARVEFALELARAYDNAGKGDDAEAQYVEILKAKDLPIEGLARACRFYAKRGKAKDAGDIAAKILAQDPKHPAGLYCKGEGLLAAGRTDDARKLFVQTTDTDKEAQYFDALGRATEKLAMETNESRWLDNAMTAYKEAQKLEPTMVNPLVGQGRLHVARREDAEAAKILADAWLLRHDGEIAFYSGLAWRGQSKSSDSNEAKAAIKWFEEAVKMPPVRPDAPYQLALLYDGLNVPAKAAANYAAATKLALEDVKAGAKQPSWYAEALYQQGRLYEGLNNLSAAREAYQQYLGTNPAETAERTKELRNKLATTLRK